MAEDQPVGPLVSQPALLIALNALYVGFGAVLGLIQGGLPPLILSSGWNIGHAGWAYAFYMPFGLAFLWAPLVDRFRPPGMRSRIGWVVWMQAITLLSVIGAAFAPAQAFGLLIAFGFTAAFAMATMDLALDGIAVETVSPRFRGWAAGTKLTALALGSMFGGGLLVARFDVWGREASFLVLAGLLTVLAVPLILLHLTENTANRRSARASLRHLFGDKTSRARLFLLVIVCAIIFPATGLNRLMLVSMGVPLSQIGWVVGTLGPVGLIVASVIAIPLINTLGHRWALLIFGGTSLLSIGLMFFGIINQSSLPAMVGAVTIGGSIGGIFVVYAALILGWARGPQPVTDYAAYYGIGRFVAALAMLLSSQLVQFIDWAWYFAAMAVLFVGLMIHFNRKIST
ncbi:hypothetical protein [Roseibium algae]|uniref:MFS transporter n=1 Tax=Roseibium algae TaxID=3123038 RepID=A0ABU8TSY3_9HYPH